MQRVKQPLQRFVMCRFSTWGCHFLIYLVPLVLSPSAQLFFQYYRIGKNPSLHTLRFLAKFGVYEGLPGRPQQWPAQILFSYPGSLEPFH